MYNVVMNNVCRHCQILCWSWSDDSQHRRCCNWSLHQECSWLLNSDELNDIKLPTGRPKEFYFFVSFIQLAISRSVKSFRSACWRPQSAAEDKVVKSCNQRWFRVYHEHNATRSVALMCAGKNHPSNCRWCWCIMMINVWQIPCWRWCLSQHCRCCCVLMTLPRMRVTAQLRSHGCDDIRGTNTHGVGSM